MREAARLQSFDDDFRFVGSYNSKARQIAPAEIDMMPKVPVEIEGRKLPVAWHLAIPSLALSIDCAPLNAKSWMRTSFSYWEGPIGFVGSHSGVGYLELTGY